jgi:hypothetical protein
VKTAGMLLSLVVVLAIGYYFYSVQVAPGPATQVSPKELIDVVGVKNDLLSIAQAERLFLAANGNYGSFEQLQQDGSITFSATNRRSYNFVVEPNSAQGFRPLQHRLIHRSEIGPLFRLMKPCSSPSAKSSWIPSPPPDRRSKAPILNAKDLPF